MYWTLIFYDISSILYKVKSGTVEDGLCRGGGGRHATCIKVSKEKSVNITITFNDTSLLLLAQNLIWSNLEMLCATIDVLNIEGYRQIYNLKK